MIKLLRIAHSSKLLRIAHSSFCGNIYSSSDNLLMDCDHCCQELIQLRDVALSTTRTKTQVDKNFDEKVTLARDPEGLK